MGFLLVPKYVTLNDLERRNGHVVCVISPNSVAFGTYCVKVVEIHRHMLRVKCNPNSLVFSDITYGDICMESPPVRALK